jgi:hypothetical protein
VTTEKREILTQRRDTDRQAENETYRESGTNGEDKHRERREKTRDNKKLIDKDREKTEG